MEILKKKVLYLLVVIFCCPTSFVGQNLWDAFVSSLPFTDRFIDPEECWRQALQPCVISPSCPIQFWMLQWGLAKSSVITSATVMGWTLSSRDYSQAYKALSIKYLSVPSSRSILFHILLSAIHLGASFKNWENFTFY